MQSNNTITSNDVGRKNNKSIIRCAADSSRAKSTKVSYNNKRPVKEVEGLNVKEIVRPIVEAFVSTNLNYWDVVDTGVFTDRTGGENDGQEFTLVMVHYTDVAKELEKFYLKGIIIDISENRIVMDNVGAIPTTCVPFLEMDKPLKMVQRTSIDLSLGKESESPFVITEETRIWSAYEGFIMRAFRHRGVTFFTTNKSLDISKSFRAVSDQGNMKFLDMYYQANGPRPEEIFDLSKPYSDTCHVFNVSHPLLYNATKQEVNYPFIIDISSYPMNKKVDGPFVQSLWERDLVGTQTYDRSNEHLIPDRVDKGGVMYFGRLTVEDANYFLKHGYHQNAFPCEFDNTLRFGESLLVVNGAQIVRVNSPSYQFRANLRGSEANILRRIASLIDASAEMAKRKKREMKDSRVNEYSLRVAPLLAGFEVPDDVVNLFLSYLHPEDHDLVRYYLGALRMSKDMVTKESQVRELFLANFLYASPFGLLNEVLKAIRFIGNEFAAITNLLLYGYSIGVMSEDFKKPSENTQKVFSEFIKYRSRFSSEADLDRGVFFEGMKKILIKMKMKSYCELSKVYREINSAVRFRVRVNTGESQLPIEEVIDRLDADVSNVEM